MAEGLKSPATLSSVDAEDTSFDDVETAITGINMLLNNGFDEAFVLFQKYKDESPLMHSGYSFVFFMQALMSFEEEKLAEAVKILQETEKRCEVSDGFVRSFKRKFSKKKKTADTLSIEDRIQRQVIVADSLLYQAILIFTNQDIPSYIKGGWHLRKAWKIYDKLHHEITALKEKMSANKIQEMETGMTWQESAVDPNSGFQDAVLSSSETMASPSKSSVPSTPTTKYQGLPVKSSLSESNGDVGSATACLSEESLARLLGAVNFGYGTFQLCMSMVPPKILKLIEFLGFEGEREIGLACLQYTSHSRDMKAPLATLALLWYHTVLRPFFALDGANNYSAGTQDAETIIHEKEAAFPNSSLFLFFRGRIHRLRRETDLSYDMYKRAHEEAKGQREIELMCLYEISWFNLIRLNWEKSMEGFERLRKESKWSKCYYSYLMAVCLGSQGLIQESHEIFREVPSLMKRKNNQIEVFSVRRAEKFKKEAPTQELCRLLTLELVFLWHTLPTCNHDDLRHLLEVCDMQTDPKIFHLKCLLEGAIFKELEETEMATQCLKEALARHNGKKEDGHVAAFALFELAAIYMKTPETKPMAREHLQLIKDSYKDYDFENRLSVRVNNALKQLKRSSTAV
ncbi:LOW QUALITY PROTEIN: tetratricopeptide repeat protein 39C-like [Babylonia areolata]|uniref:LOW QUALITY PROTEIN: tetratricopeptide repeat protein 39C-like n=1 Tax=Babylonia areolata TaxID=304850 RepID=UPI003FD36A7C